jgi:hypothetical protein
VIEDVLAAVPSEIAGLPTWALNGLSIGSLVLLIIGGLASSRLWTKSQVDIIRADHTKAITDLNKVHDRQISDLNKVHDREVTDAKQRFETHFNATVEQYKSRVAEAVSRENDWRDVSRRWQSVAEMLSSGIEPMQEQSTAVLAILQAWQAAAIQRPGRKT